MSEYESEMREAIRGLQALAEQLRGGAASAEQERQAREKLCDYVAAADRRVLGGLVAFVALVEMGALGDDAVGLLSEGLIAGVARAAVLRAKGG